MTTNNSPPHHIYLSMIPYSSSLSCVICADDERKRFWRRRRIWWHDDMMTWRRFYRLKTLAAGSLVFQVYRQQCSYYYIRCVTSPQSKASSSECAASICDLWSLICTAVGKFRFLVLLLHHYYLTTAGFVPLCCFLMNWRRRDSFRLALRIKNTNKADWEAEYNNTSYWMGSANTIHTAVRSRRQRPTPTESRSSFAYIAHSSTNTS